MSNSRLRDCNLQSGAVLWLRHSFARAFTDVLDEIKRIDEIKVEFNYNSKYDETEFARQLADQQKGMNELTVQEYLDNRQKYIEQGRAIESNAAQQAAREKAFVDKVDELQDAGLSLKEAEEQAQKWLDTQAALHNPDQVRQATEQYHVADNVDAVQPNPYEEGSFENTLFAKNMVDAVQWHLEDIIRDPEIDPVAALELKRRIDRSNQVRTDMVEQLDSYFLDKYIDVAALEGATINTESPAWALDRLSILALKIYHMEAEVARTDASEAHLAKCGAKLAVLREQLVDLTTALDQLLDDIEAGRKYMKVYRQMKMYNDAETNPVLYASKTPKA